MLHPMVMDAPLDQLVFLLLTRLRSGVDMLNGVDAAMMALYNRTKPVCIVVCADERDDHVSRILEQVRQAALAHMVPVVVSMTPEWLGSACKAVSPQFVVTVVGLPNRQSQAFAAAVMARAAADANAMSQRHLDIVELPVVQDDSLSRLMGLLAINAA